MNKYEPKDYIVLIFAITISILLLAILGDIIANRIKLNEASVDILGDIVTAILAIVSVYIGHSLRIKSNNTDETE